MAQRTLLRDRADPKIHPGGPSFCTAKQWLRDRAEDYRTQQWVRRVFTESGEAVPGQSPGGVCNRKSPPTPQKSPPMTSRGDGDFHSRSKSSNTLWIYVLVYE